jgi:hypothetical protein
MLIAIPKDFVPAPAQVQAFLEAVCAAGTVPAEERQAALRTPSQRMREGRNPATGEIIRFRGTDRAVLSSPSGISAAIGVAGEYRAEVCGTGVPELAPLPLDFDPPYYVGVVCRVSAVLRSTSDLHEESKRNVVDFDEAFTGTDRTGYFTDPYDVEMIEVPEAGCARFWIEFEFGNSVFPPEEAFGRSGLDLLDPRVLGMAKDAFGVEFVQGCSWG